MPGVHEKTVDFEIKTLGRSIAVTTPERWPIRWRALLKKPLLCGVLIALVGCHAAPPPAPPPPPPPPPAPVVEAPPPPKCEKVEEACVAKAETRARIGLIGWQFAPPESWVYAQGEALTIASNKNAVLGVAAKPTGDVKKERSVREEALRLIAGQLSVTLPKKKTLVPKKPDSKQKVADVDVDLYQIEGAKLEGRTGPLLFFVAKASNEQILVGIGFVSDDDGNNADQAIMAAIESLRPSAGDAAAAEKKVP